ncbi:hypothetical protein BGX28_000601 [Mortierella sp. GBA30]|nr:hypothetical protein BGX28_000601 [Mortierella sp. GBA30]
MAQSGEGSSDRDQKAGPRKGIFDDMGDDEIDELEDEDHDQEGDEDETEDVFEVEKVVGHKRERGGLSYFIKWKGYDSKDNTWETEDQVFCDDLVQAYWDRYISAGGKKSDTKGADPKPQGIKRTSTTAKSTGAKRATPSRASQEPLLPEHLHQEQKEASPTKKNGRDSEDNITMEHSPVKKQKTESNAAAEQAARLKEENEASMAEKNTDRVREQWPPKSWTTWEDEVDYVQTVERTKKKMRVYLVWKNGKETDHPIEDAHTKCPLKLIRFYEEHLKFTQS